MMKLAFLLVFLGFFSDAQCGYMGMGGAGMNMIGGGGMGMSGAGMMSGGGAGMIAGGGGQMMSGGMMPGTGMMTGGAGMIGGGAGMVGSGAGIMGGGAGMMTGGKMMGAGMGMGGAGMGMGGAGMMGAGMSMMGGVLGMGGMHGYGGAVVDQGAYSGGNKKLNDMKYQQAQGGQGGEFNNGQTGYAHGGLMAKDIQGNSGYYGGANGGRNLYEDGRMYHGGNHFDKKGNNAGEMKYAKGHKKGHKVKGFKNSHQKSETGKTEEFYDEEHDEGGNFMLKGQMGSFGQNEGAAYKGGKQDGAFKSVQGKQQGHFDKEFLTSNNKGNEGRYGEAKYGKGGSIYGINNGFGVNGMVGHHSYNKFFNKHPFYNYYY